MDHAYGSEAELQLKQRNFAMKSAAQPEKILHEVMATKGFKQDDVIS